jgi:signal transduction histidine kinase
VSLGLPSHLAREANSRALAAGARWAGLVCLGSAVVNVGISSARTPGASPWVAILVLAPMVGLLIALARGRTRALTIAYLLVGSVCTYFYAVALFLNTPAYRDSSLFVIALPVVAMTLVGGAGTGALRGILWATLGYALAEGAIVLATVTTHRVYAPNAIALGAYLLFVAVLAFDGLTRGVRATAQSALHRAMRDSRLVQFRLEGIARATAEVHDTFLSDLTAVASATAGPLDPRLRDRLEQDLRSLGVLVDDEDPSVGRSVPDAWEDSGVSRAIEDARDEGLAVEVSGDREALALLGSDERRALGLAVRQCLANVLKHSGSANAEVALSAAAGSVSVMVVDGGSGFSQSSPAPDRLGLRQSVRDRIERVGGTVAVYSSEDVGTTVIMVVPVSAAADGSGDRS